MRLNRRLAVVFGVIPALCFAVLLSLPRVRAEEVPLRNGGHRDINLKLGGVVDLVNRRAGDDEIPMHPYPIQNGVVSSTDKEHRATLGFTFSGAQPEHKAPLILAQTADGEYFCTEFGQPDQGNFSGAAFLSVRPGESFYLVARESGEEVGRWKISGLTPSADQAAEKDRIGVKPPGPVEYGIAPPSSEVKCSLEQVDQPIADGFTRTYRLHYQRVKSHPNETLDKVTEFTAGQEVMQTDGLSDEGVVPSPFTRDREHYVSVWGRLVTLPGNPITLHFHRAGPRHWEAVAEGKKFQIRPSKEYGDRLECVSTPASGNMILMVNGAQLLDESPSNLVNAFALPNSDFLAEGFDQSGPNFESFQSFHNVLDTTKPDKITRTPPRKNWDGDAIRMEVLMFSPTVSLTSH